VGSGKTHIIQALAEKRGGCFSTVSALSVENIFGGVVDTGVLRNIMDLYPFYGSILLLGGLA
jgi:hypothetical protein